MCTYNIGNANIMDGTRLNSLEEYNVFSLLYDECVCGARTYMYFYHRSCITSSFLFANKIDARPFNVALCVYVYSD